MVGEPLRIEERFIPGEYLIKAYPDLWFNRRKGYAGFLTNMRFFFGDGRQLHDLSLRNVDTLTWGRARRWSWKMLILSLTISLIFIAAPWLMLILWLVFPALWWFWMEDALVMRVGSKEVIIFGTPRALNDIARNIRLHQAVLRSGEAGGVLGQRILEAMPMDHSVPPPEGGPLALNYAQQVARGEMSDSKEEEADIADHEGTNSEDEPDQEPPWLDNGKKKPELTGSLAGLKRKEDVEGRHALSWLERQASSKNQNLATKLAYKLWAGKPNPTRLLLILAHILLLFAIFVYVIADTIAYFNEEAASPFTRFAQLLVMGGLGALLGVILQQMDNRYRGVEPKRDEVVLKVRYSNRPLRVICHRIAHFFILSTLAVTFLVQNLGPFILGAGIGSIIMAGGRIVNLSVKPNWLHQTKPFPKWRSAKLGFNVVRVFVVIIVVGITVPYFEDHDAAIPQAQLDSKTQNGWVLEEDHSFSRGFGTVQGGLRLYLDDGRNAEGDQDGYPALLVLITLKEPRDFLLEDLLKLIDESVEEQLREQQVQDLEVWANQTRVTDQGYTTHFTIFNATARGSLFFTKGEQVHIIGEGWYAKNENVMVVAVGIAQVSDETLDKAPELPDTPDYPGKELVDEGYKLWEELVQQNDIPNDPTNTTNEQNWLELLGLIPTVTAA